jgi:hypothetical protein
MDAETILGLASISFHAGDFHPISMASHAPADRLIAAIAIEYNCPWATVDTLLKTILFIIRATAFALQVYFYDKEGIWVKNTEFSDNFFLKDDPKRVDKII